MDQNNSNDGQNVPPHSAPFRTLRNASEDFRTIPNASATFGNVPYASERNENHTLTTREVARMFEIAGVPRTERSITNWCQPTRSGMARLDAYFDPNERKYFITQQSVELAMQEEKAKAVRTGDHSERFGNVPNESERVQKEGPSDAKTDMEKFKKLEQELLDLKITNRGKDYYIEQLQKERKTFADERADYVEKLITANRTVGELANKLLQLTPPGNVDNGHNST